MGPVVCIPIIDTNTLCGRQLNPFDCQNMEGVTGCMFDPALGCYEACAYEPGVCEACGCVLFREDCITRDVVEEANNAPMRIDVLIESAFEEQMIEGVDDIYVYIGIVLFALMFIGILAFMAYKYHRRNRKKYVEMEEENINALQMDEIEVEAFGTR